MAATPSIQGSFDQDSPIKPSGGHHTYLYTPQGLGKKEKRENWIWKTHDPTLSSLDSIHRRHNHDGLKSGRSSHERSRRYERSDATVDSRSQSLFSHKIQRPHHHYTRSEELPNARPWAFKLGKPAAAPVSLQRHLSLVSPRSRMSGPDDKHSEDEESSSRFRLAMSLKKKPLPPLPKPTAPAVSPPVQRAEKTVSPRPSGEDLNRVAVPFTPAPSPDPPDSEFDSPVPMPWLDEQQRRQQQSSVSTRHSSLRTASSRSSNTTVSSPPRSLKTAPKSPPTLYNSFRTASRTSSQSADQLFKDLLTPPSTPPSIRETHVLVRERAPSEPPSTAGPESIASPTLIIQHPPSLGYPLSPLEAITEAESSPIAEMLVDPLHIKKRDVAPVRPWPLREEAEPELLPPALRVSIPRTTASDFAGIGFLIDQPAPPEQSDNNNNNNKRQTQQFRLGPAPSVGSLRRRTPLKAHGENGNRSMLIRRSQSLRSVGEKSFATRETWLAVPADICTAEMRPAFASPVVAVGTAKLVKL